VVTDKAVRLEKDIIAVGRLIAKIKAQFVKLGFKSLKLGFSFVETKVEEV